MDRADYRAEIVESIWAQAVPPDEFSHQPRLHELAKALGKEGPHDDDVLFAAAWLRDLGVFVGHRPEDPAELAARDCVAYAMANAPGFARSSSGPTGGIRAELPPVHERHSVLQYAKSFVAARRSKAKQKDDDSRRGLAGMSLGMSINESFMRVMAPDLARRLEVQSGIDTEQLNKSKDTTSAARS